MEVLNWMIFILVVPWTPHHKHVWNTDDLRCVFSTNASHSFNERPVYKDVRWVCLQQEDRKYPSHHQVTVRRNIQSADDERLSGQSLITEHLYTSGAEQSSDFYSSKRKIYLYMSLGGWFQTMGTKLLSSLWQLNSKQPYKALWFARYHPAARRRQRDQTLRTCKVVFYLWCIPEHTAVPAVDKPQEEDSQVNELVLPVKGVVSGVPLAQTQ